MQKVTAADMTHAMHMVGMDMSPSASSSHCDHCPQDSTLTAEPSPLMDCSKGHCLMHALPAESAGLEMPHPPLIVAAGLAQSALPYLPILLEEKQDSTAPPGLVTNTQTVVLLF